MIFRELLYQSYFYLLKSYSFFQIQILKLLDYLHKKRFSCYYKIDTFYNEKITTQYKKKEENILEFTNKKYDLMRIEDNKLCFVLVNSTRKKKLDEDTLLFYIPFKVCQFVFNLILLTIDNKEYEIKLKNYDYNYYIVGNEINIHFLNYFAKKHLGLKKSFTQYKVEFIDSNANYINDICEKDTIILYEDKYDISQFVIILK